MAWRTVLILAARAWPALSYTLEKLAPMRTNPAAPYRWPKLYARMEPFMTARPAPTPSPTTTTAATTIPMAGMGWAIPLISGA